MPAPLLSCGKLASFVLCINLSRTLVMRKELGKFLLDVAKLVIGGVLLAAIMDDVTNRWGIYSFGILATLALVLTGLYLINNKENEED